MGTLHMKFRSLDDLKNDVKTAVTQAIKHGEKTVQKQDTIYFTSLQEFQSCMTEQKYIILAAIYHSQPQSVYQLAKIVQRDVPNVKRDCDMLEQLGFIVQTHTDEGRKGKQPRLKFPYDRIVVCAEGFQYSHNLNAA